MATNLSEYMERGLTVIAYGARKQMLEWIADNDPDGFYPVATGHRDTGSLRIHIARRLLVLAEVPDSAGLGAGPMPAAIPQHREGDGWSTGGW